MKLFTNFCGYFVLMVSTMLGLVCVIGMVNSISNYLKCEEELGKVLYLKASGNYLAYMFIILAIGFALSAIIYLLRHIAYKDEK